MHHHSTDDLSRRREQIEHKWREATQLSIDLYLRANDETDFATLNEIDSRLDSVLTELEAPLPAPDLYDDLIAMFA